MNKNSSYMEIATMAARLETEGNYARAAFLWDTAMGLAKNAANEAWCQARLELCGRKKNTAFDPR
ncbi:ANR family transcriptional regulator [Enterobacter ludwigii]|uniref:ANR family transcriptional regulator n=1 Tax=Enterobacter ludwigii TaxID=299767 RepID=UPI003076713C